MVSPQPPEAIDGEIARVGMDGRGPRVSMLLDMRLRASRWLMEALDRFGATSLARARWAREPAEGESVAASIARRRCRGGRGTSLGFTERSALQAIIESPDPRVTANERLRAIELLRDAGDLMTTGRSDWRGGCRR